MADRERKPRILCVDDETKNLELLKAMLEPRGYEVLLAYGGQDALDKVGKEQVDLVLLDIMMPEISGYEVLKKLRNDDKNKFLPIIMITALTETADKIEMLELGCDDFVSKPFNKHELLSRIKSLLRIKMLHDDLETSYDKMRKLELYKENLTDMVVHDMKNLVMGIEGNLSLLGRMVALETDDQKKIHGNALESSRSLIRMMSDLLDISRMEENKLKLKHESIDLDAVIQHSISSQETLAKSLEKAFKMDVQFSGKGMLHADADLVERIIVNLLSNALKFSTARGVITVSTWMDKGENAAVVCVENEGPGIPREFHDKIFEKFAQIEVKNAGLRYGKGLGLTFCKMAVEAHKGRIWIEDSPSGGITRFLFTLPLIKG